MSIPPTARKMRGSRFILTLPDGRAGRCITFLTAFLAKPQPNPVISGPVFSGSRSTRRQVVVYQNFVRFDSVGRSALASASNNGANDFNRALDRLRLENRFPAMISLISSVGRRRDAALRCGSQLR